MKSGKINVQTENIFPIIKKFLYSDHEIFLRELVSNAVDASQKLATLSSRGNVSGDLGDLTIEVKADKENKTLTVIDRGIGMTAEEVEKYINQIAFSSATEFVEKYKGKSEEDVKALIGHFGLGFYSTFMVADKVEIYTKTYKKGKGTKAIRWECDGSPEYTLEETDKTDRGTEIVLHIAEDSLEFLEEHRIQGLLTKYCKFLPVPIRFGDETYYEESDEKDEEGKPKQIEKKRPKIINNTDPAWKKMPADLTDEDYKVFYRELYPATFDEPLFNIHLNVDYPFNLTGILYFPKVKNNFEVQRDKIQLYCNQVFVTDSVEGLVPDFLTLLHGVIDSPDIPLNVSRSYLQSDANVKKISGHITKKVSDKLEEIFKDNREEFENKWDDIKVFIEYGMISEPKFYERAESFCLLKNTESKYFTLEEYREAVKENQTGKDEKQYFLYANNAKEQHSYIQNAIDKGYDVLLLDGVLDTHFVNHLEQKLEKIAFVRVDADTVDNLIPKEDNKESELPEEEQKALRELFVKHTGEEKFNVMFRAMGENEKPLLITRPEFMRRMRDMSKVGGGGGFMGEMPESLNLVVNTDHELVQKLNHEEAEVDKDQLSKQLTDLALLSQNMLEGEDLTTFIKRSLEMIK